MEERIQLSHYNVAVIRGDGIGIEVIEEGIKVLNAVGREYGIDWTWTEHPWGSEFYREHGVVMPADGLDTLAEADVIFLGAVGHPDFQDHITLGDFCFPYAGRSTSTCARGLACCTRASNLQSKATEPAT